ncbi:type IV pilus modification protein PilV [Teredinibacter haidensis]|uniref:type IV pilus modification protein PilV n=1 Tax=Teredinibacter haidensis TaxID=2731755 RepID=UPI000948BD7A|nr:type IV pilus modification protein PilV [Teredinibacter haidensis]
MYGQSNKSINTRNLYRQRGAAMMEVVVALFVLAIGLMGTLSMQVKGVNSSQRAHFVTDANILAADMADRILAYNSDDITSDDDDYSGIYTDSSTATSSSCSSGGCNSAAQKSFDEWEWSEQIKSRLPGGTGEVFYVDGAYTIVVKWNQPDTFSNSTCSSISVSMSDTATNKACFAYQVRL